MTLRDFPMITVDAGSMGGVPCVRGLRIPVATVLRLVVGGYSEAETVAEYPDLRLEDVRACLEYAQEAGDEGF